MRLVLPVLLAVAAIAPTSVWANATVSRGTCPAGVAGACLFYNGSGNEFDSYDFTQDAGSYYFTPMIKEGPPPQPTGTAITASVGCTQSGTSAGCPKPASALVIDAAGGDDVLSRHLVCCELRVIADMGPGDDLLRGSRLPDVMQGGPGNDFLASYQGDDRLDGGPGDDGFDPQNGDDDVAGGAGYDTIVYYKGPSQPLTVTLDGRANDGEAGEHDNIRADVEDITGGDGNDVLTGNDQGNVLRGDLGGDNAGGRDVIDGGGGVDSLFGNGGDDELRARDGNPETIDCGVGNDRAIVDTTDTIRNCERVDASPELVPDFDGDGVRKPADCNDANPAIHPGAVDILENGVDEDCSGGDAVNLDRDGDRFQRPIDCNDADRRIHPGATDVPGNRIDEDCRGGDAAYPVLDSAVGYASLYFRRYSRFTDLFVRKALAGSTVRLRCEGRGCRFKTKTRKVRRNARKFPLLSLVRGAKLRPRAWIEVRITKPGTVGIVTRLTVRGGRQMARNDLCLPPAARKPGRCAL